MISTSTITDRDEALRYLYGRIDYERTLTIPYHQQRLKLDRMRRLLDRLDNPHLDRPVVHIAGTKGKGSTAAMIAAILSAAGYTIGSFTSPHLQRLEERFAIDAMPCGEDDFVALVDRLRPEVEAIDRQTDGDGPTYFEITTAMAMLYFSQRGVDAALMEVGLGGRLDATNVCQPVL
jgi:dihydrofolate synthase/folylpolyglutamate synthase